MATVGEDLVWGVKLRKLLRDTPPCATLAKATGSLPDVDVDFLHELIEVKRNNMALMLQGHADLRNYSVDSALAVWV